MNETAHFWPSKSSEPWSRTSIIFFRPSKTVFYRCVPHVVTHALFCFCRTLTPMVTWAQRPKLIFLTICLSDVKKHEIKVEKKRMQFKGVGGPDQKEYAVDMEFLKEIDTEVRFNLLY